MWRDTSLIDLAIKGLRAVDNGRTRSTGNNIRCINRKVNRMQKRIAINFSDGNPTFICDLTNAPGDD